MTILKIHTDGGCSGNQHNENLGGWGAVLEFGEHKKELFGSEKNTTNNRMEMTALLEAFLAIKKPNQTIQVFSDSGYLMDCFRQEWYKNWQKNGWKNKAKKPVENRDLWEQLIPFLDQHSISFYRVKGHINLKSMNTNIDEHFSKFIKWNGSEFNYEDFIHIVNMNNLADELANKGIDSIR